ncbi:hypothetical protein [Streptomyces sp. NPDC001537]
MKRLRIIVLAGAAAFTLSFGTSAEAIPKSDPSPSPTMVSPPSLHGHKAVKGTEITEWGKTKAGKSYSLTYRAGDARPAEPPVAQVSASCSIYISDVQFHGAGSSAYFQWETSQVCSGAFGWQYIRTQMWRSSWSGPRGYTPWHQTPTKTSSYIDYGWSADCDDGGGTYTYYPVMVGVASFGSSPTTRSDNDLRKNCGTYRP